MQTTPVTTIPNANEFHKFGLKPLLLKALDKIGYVQPTGIQLEVIPHLIKPESKDLVALAQTGSGKTAAFGVPLAQKLDPANDQVQALILSPTRELAAQIQDTLKPILDSVGLRSMTVYGGQSYNDQRSKVRLKPHVIIATPGRLVDLLNQKAFALSNLRVLVLDEADRMLSMGFEEDLQFILDATHSSQAGAQDSAAKSRASCQTWLFSATMGPGIKRILNRYLTNPTIVEQVQGNSGVSSTLEHQFLAVKKGYRSHALMSIMNSIQDFYGIVFCQTKREVSDVEAMLLQHKISCMSLHGDKVQKDRERVLRLLKEEKFQVLIATDVAARGLDVKNLKHVVHYSIPMEIESYVHRSGRTGRNGEEGLVISLLEPTEFSRLNRLTRVTGLKLKPFQLKNPTTYLGEQVKLELDKIAKINPDFETFQTVKKICDEALLSLDTKLYTTADWMAAFLLGRINTRGMENQSFVIQDIKAPGEHRGERRERSFSRERSGGSSSDRRPRRSSSYSRDDRSGGTSRSEGSRSEGSRSDSRCRCFAKNKSRY
ncbi:MAG: DEAD/DEAH box helicase [Bdellovibrionales bacterium]